MAGGRIDVAYVEILPDFTQFEKETNKKAKESLKGIGEEADKSTKEMERAFQKAEREIARNLRQIEKDAERAFQTTAREAAKAEKAAEQELQKLEKEHARFTAQQEREAQKAANAEIKEIERVTKASAREAQKAADTRIKEFERVGKAAERELAKSIKKQEAEIAIKVKLDQKALAKAQKEFKSGLESAFKRTALAVGIAAGAALAGGIVQSSVGIVAALVPVVGFFAATLPAAIAVGGAAITTLVLAFKGMGDAFKNMDDVEKFNEALEKLTPSARAFAIALRDSLPALKAIQQSVQEAFFAGLDVQLKGIVAVLAGPLKTGLTGISAEFNLIAKEAGKFFQSSTAVNTLNAVLATTKDIIAEFRPAITPLLTGFSALTTAALPFVKLLSGGIAQAAQEFGEFLTAAGNSGALTDFLSGALRILGDLGLILKDVGSILGSIFSTASADGASLLSRLAELTRMVADFLKSAEGKEALTTLFNTLSTASKAVLDVIKPLLPAFGSLVALAGGNLTIALQVLSAILTPIAKAFGDSLQPAIVKIADAVKPLIPSILALAKTMGEELAKSVPDLVKAFTELIIILVTEGVPILKELIPLFIELMPAITIGIKVLAAMAGTFLFLTRSTIDFIKLVGSGIGKLIEVFTELGSSIVDGLVTAWNSVKKFFSDIGSAISGFFTSTKEWFTKGFKDASDTTTGFFEKVKKFFTDLPGKVGEWLSSLPGKLKEALNTAFDNAVRGIGQAIGLILFAILELPKQIPIIFEKVKTAVSEWLSQTWTSAKTTTVNKIAELIAFLGTLGEKALTAISDLKAKLILFAVETWTSFAAWTTLKWNEIIAFIVGLPDRAVAAISSMKEKIGTFLSEMITGAKNILVTGWNNIMDFFNSIPERIGALKQTFINAGKNLIEGFMSGFKNVGNFIGDVAGSIVGTIKGFINRIIGNLNSGIADIDDKLPGSLPRIPYLAHGGITSGPTTAVIGEAGSEAVIPLDGARGRKTMAMLGGGEGGQSVTFEDGAIQIVFEGVIPTKAEATQTGEAVSAGILSALMRRDVRLEMRMI